MHKTLLNTKNLSIGYDKASILKDINVSVNEGELVALIGRNGVGKSTLLNTIKGDLEVISGEVQLANNSLKKIDTKQKARVLSAVSSLNNVMYNLRVHEIIALGRIPHTNAFGKLSKHDKVKIEEAIDQLQLSHLRDKYISQVSDGERQRVSIAKALAQDTDVIILDEPTSFLDFTNKYHILKMLRQLALENKKAILFSTHDIDVVMQFVDKIYLLTNKGIFTGAPEDLMVHGTINNYFDADDICFDTETGHVQFANSIQRQIEVKAAKKEFFWLSKAFQRNEITAIDFKGNYPYVDVVNQSDSKTVWNLVNKDAIETFYSIYDLSIRLKIIN